MRSESPKKDGSRLDIPIEFQGEISCLARNISELGMLCRTSKQLDEMTLLDIKFELPGVNCHAASTSTLWVECSGVVVNCEKKEVGGVRHPYEVSIFFDRISEKNRNLLGKYIDAEKG